MKTLYLIDGHAQFFRAYHAIRTPMTSPVTKEPTNATYGFVGMMLKLFRQMKPDYVAVAIDVSGDKETFRSEIYPEYKAHREEAPETLGPQIERCISVLEALNIPVIGIEGYEADDVIATIATKLGERDDIKLRIVSKDKDLQQLLREGHVEMFDIHKDETIDVAQLKETKQITPDQVIDMLALMGDTVDNVPGVPGIGPKTAAQLIAEYGSLDAILEEVKKGTPKIKGKRLENIRAAAEMLPMSRELVTLRHDAPVKFELEAAAMSKIDLPKLMPILKELGFNRYQDELRELIGGKVDASEQASAGADFGGGGLFDALEQARELKSAGKYEAVTTKKRLDALVKELTAAEIFAVDTETTSLSPMDAELCGLSFSTRAGEGTYVPVRSPDPSKHLDEQTVLEALRPILEDPAKAKCGHNLKYDALILRRAGVELRGFDKPSVIFDSMIASYLIDAARSSHSLDNLALALLQHTCIKITELIGTGKKQKRFDEVPLDDAVIYAAEDADVSLRLYEGMRGQLRAMKLEKLFRELEMPLVAVLAELEWNGITVDPAELDRQAARLSERIEALKGQIVEASPRAFNPDSPKQLAGILFNKPDHDEPGLGIKPLKKTKTGYSTDVEVLEKLAADLTVESPVPGLIVEYRQLTKLVGTYLTALKEAINDETGRIHASFNQTVAATGRLSSSDPNLQNIPIRTEVGREIRKAFVAAPGHLLIGADYSQIELRLLAHLSRDPALKSAFEQGEDIHRAVAAQIHGVKPEEVTGEQRNGAKMVNFGIVYGITPFGLARRLGISNTEAGEIIDGYKARFAGITTFLEECISQARRFGYVETILGRRRPVTGIDARNPTQRALAERVAINSVVQGSAADLIKLAMVDLHARLTSDAALKGVKMLVQIHDELLFEAPEAQAEAASAVIVSRMEEAMSLDVPLVVEHSVGKDWYEAK